MKLGVGVVLSAVQFFTRSNTGASALHGLIEQLAPVTLVNLSYQSGWLFSRSNLPAMVLFAKAQAVGACRDHHGADTLVSGGREKPYTRNRAG